MLKIDKVINKLIEVSSYSGLLLQQIKIKMTPTVPTMGVMFNKFNKFELHINPEFAKRLSLEQYVAVLKHEMLHLVHKHVPLMKHYQINDRPMVNIAMDMSINQLIKDLPNGCSECPKDKPCENEMCPGKAVFVENFLDSKGSPMELNKPFEFYFRELKRFV